MKLLIFNWQDRTHPLSGGAEVHLHEIFGRMARAGHDVTLVCCGHRGAKRKEQMDGMTVYRIGRRTTFNYSVSWWWRFHGKKINPDIVIDDINKIPFFTPRFVKKPILALIHHFFGDSIFKEVGIAAGSYVKYFEDKVSKVYSHTRVCVVSESTKLECLEKGFSASQIDIVYNAINQSDFPMRVGVKAEVPTVASFGRLKKYKSIDHLVQAIALVKNTIPNVRLRIAGTGDEQPTLVTLVHQMQLHDNVEFCGYISDTDKAPLLSSAHVVVNTSIKEGWGITNLEANACGTTVISADVPGLRDSVRDGYSGLLYPYGDVEALARLIERVLVDVELRNRLSNGAVEWASTFTWERSAREMTDICEKTIAQWNASRPS
ncbi:MAG: glycosyltransferase family 4 protein [Ignavibacteria bacterium]|nr:glycosyltransferase family 4 protein [Ignavibacteria bacterium]